MIIGFKDSTKLLYHYTKMSVAKDWILRSGKLMMGSFRKTNDPKESKTWSFNLGTNEHRDLGKYKMDEMSRALSDALKDRGRVLCFSKDVGPLNGDHLREIHQRGFSYPRMWAQYADAHKGVCLVFDREQLSRQVEHSCSEAVAIYRGDIVYRNRSVVANLDEGDYFINIDNIEQYGAAGYWKWHLKNYHQRLFFEKLQDWRDENEFRFAAFFDSPRDVFIDIADSLVGVVFGDSADANEVDDIIELLLPTKATTMGLKWKNCSPWYDFGNFKYDQNLRNSPWAKKK